MIKAAVFDLDHTLFDRYATIEKVIPELRKKVNTPENITDEYFCEQLCFADRQFVHHGWEEIHAYLIKRGIVPETVLYEDYKEAVLSCFKGTAVPFDFSINVLSEIRKLGVKTGLITNGRHEVQASKLKLLGLENSFDDIVISGDYGFSKPDERIFRAAAKNLGVEMSEMMYVGDHPQCDVDGSRRAGCTPVWVKTTGTWIFPEIEKPELQVETVKEIPAILERLNG